MFNQPTPSGLTDAVNPNTSSGTSPPNWALLKPDEVARRLGVSRSWLYAAAGDGRIPSIRLGTPDGPLRFIPTELDTWLEQARSAWTPGNSSTSNLTSAAATARTTPR